LIVADVDCGVFSFAVDLSTPQGPLPGVRLSNPMEMPLVPFDYGLVGFNDVRIPFDAWLADGATIDASARFHDPLEDATERLARTLTAAQNIWGPGSIGLAAAARASASQALHFSARRTSMARVGREVPLLYFNTQRRVLFRSLGASYVITCLANEASREWADSLRHRVQLDKSTTPMMWAPWSATNRKLALVKAMTASTTEEVATQSRQHCGVAGVLLANRFLDYLGMGQVFNDASGNNNLILLDTARFLASGAIQPTRSQVIGQEWSEAGAAIDALRHREHRLIDTLASGVQERTDQGLESLEVWNPLLPLARDAAEAHGLNLAVDAAITATDSTSNGAARDILRDLTSLFVFDRAHRHAASLISEGLVDAKQYPLLDTAIDQLCERLMPHVETLIDAFGYPQSIIQSPVADSTQTYAAALARKLGVRGVGACTSAAPRCLSSLPTRWPCICCRAIARSSTTSRSCCGCGTRSRT